MLLYTNSEYICTRQYDDYFTTHVRFAVFLFNVMINTCAECGGA